MRVMQIHFWSDARNLTGSVEKVLRGFAALQAPDIELDIASCGRGEPEVVDQARYVFFAEDRLRNRVFNKWFRLGAFTYPSLVKLIESRRPDILHFHNRQELVDAVVRRLSYRPRVLVHYHRNFFPYAVPRRADCLVAVSEALRLDLLESARPAMPVEVIHNPVPAGIAGEGDVPPRPRGANPRLLYGGGRQEHKGFFELEKALQAPALAGKFDVVLCGPALEGYTPGFAAETLGYLNQPDFRRQLLAADIVVMPSHREGFPLLALESMSLGKLLVTTDAGGLREIAHAGNSIVHAIGSAEGLTAALRSARELFEPENESRLQALKRAAQATAAGFSPEVINHKLAEFYRAIYGSKQ